ncbi:hypothetical protein B296_00011004 [Ensete ventricosum]|uniref:RRM domain-containing protein n=1 Tax=Ensete ventricosum TaxID=4639 RepID=A0A427B2J8_ENSVE|nr:hypothetical protein B296_00011004 [Ensete ventricosum]
MLELVVLPQRSERSTREGKGRYLLRRGAAMTLDDEKSIYVGGLPYDCTQEDLRRAFDLYGAIVDVKVRHLTLLLPGSLLFYHSPSCFFWEPNGTSLSC